MVVHLFLYLVALVVSVIFHEQWHARVALWLGDPTGKLQGRLSWNPGRHLDPIMSLVVPFVTYFSTGVAFGGARPVSINPLNFRNPPLGFALSAGVGPVSNFVLAGGGFGLLWLLWTVAPSFVYSANSDTVTYNGLFLGIFITLNVGLGAFNLLPLPGLDGSRLLWYLLPPRGREVLDRMEPFAMGITYLLILIGATRVLWPATVGAWMAIFAVFGGDFGNALLHAVFRR